MPWDNYFDETPPDKYRYLGYYKHRKNSQILHTLFRKKQTYFGKSGLVE